MSTSVTMPALGESVSEGTVTRWLKQEGEQVDADEPLLEVSTDKVDTEIPSPAAGVLQRIVVAEDETVAVGAELAVIGDGDAAAGDAAAGDAAAGGAAAGDAAATEDAAAATGDASPEDPETAQPAPADQQAVSTAEPDQPDAPPAAGAGERTTEGGTSVTMPALGESVSEGTVTRWLKQEGEQVDADEPLLEVSTDKVDTEIPSPAAGVLQRIVVAEDETVAVGAELAVIGGGAGAGGGSGAGAESGQPQEQETEGTEDSGAPADVRAPSEQAQESPAPAVETAPPAPPARPAPASDQGSTSGGAGERSDSGSYVTPLVRKLAAEHGVELSSLQGSGVGGRIRKQDVLEAAKNRQQNEQPAPAAPDAPVAPAAAAGAGDRGGAPAGSASALRGTTEKMSRLRKTIATRMVESLQVSAQLTTVVEVDLTRIARLRARAKDDFEAREGARLSFLPFLAKATVEALKTHPKLNASIDTDKGEITYFDVENLGVAVDTERGLLVPVVQEAGDLNIAGLARKIADLAARTRSNKITPDELGGGTFTLTNTGSRGALFDTPIINQPQVAILGTGAVVKRPVVVDDLDLGETTAIRSMCYLALSYDHRIVDGADAARFLATVKARLEEGAFDADLGL